eukprot:gene14303-16439_t
METFSTTLDSLIGFLQARNSKVLHKVYAPCLNKLLFMAEIFKGRDACEDEKVLFDLLQNMLKEECLFNSFSDNNLLISLLKAATKLFVDIVSQASSNTSSQSAIDHFLQTIPELHAIVATAISESGDVVVEETVEKSVFEDVLKCPNYISHYKACHEDFSSTVVVVLWKSPTPGPAVLCDGHCILYVHSATNPHEDFGSLGNFRPFPNVYNAREMEEAARVRATIERNKDSLFAEHSRLVGIKGSGLVKGKMYIDLVVDEDHVPTKDTKRLPSDVEGVPTRVQFGTPMLIGPYR